MVELYDTDGCANIGKKYLQLGINQFKNVHLRRLCQDHPCFTEILRVYNGWYEDRTEQIVVEADKVKRNEKNFDLIFQSNIEKSKFFSVTKKVELTDKE